MATCRLGGLNSERKSNSNHEENFSVFHVFCVFISLVTILADLTTDILVLAEYCKNGHIYWALPTLIFMLLPNILINIFSLRWLMIDNNNCMKLWISHCFLVGLIERYTKILHEVFWCKNLEAIKCQKLISQRNDLALLHFLYIHCGTIPQIILQTYAIISLNDNYHTKVFALAASATSVIWGFSTYLYNSAMFGNKHLQWVPFLVKLNWQLCMLSGRIAAIFLFVVIFGVWTLVPIGLHWTAMTFWIITQQTTFCPNKLEETFYNVVMGFVYCFSFINLRDGYTRYRLMMYNTLTISQNIGSLILYILIAQAERQRKCWSVVAITVIVMGNIIGLCSMVLYYRYFHAKGPILWKYNPDNIELNNKNESISNNNEANSNVRSFKSSHKTDESKNNTNETSMTVQPAHNATEIADKRFLIRHILARAGSSASKSAAIQNLSMDASSIEVYTVENTPMPAITRDDNFKTRKIKICSPTELTLKLNSIEDLESSIDEITSNNIILQKRRGICSSDDLTKSLRDLNLVACDIINEEFIKSLKTDQTSELSHDTQGSNKKTSSDSIDLDLDLSFSDINSSDINTFNENIVQKLCLSALKNIKVGNQDADIENIQRIALDILKEMYTKKDKIKNGINNDTLLLRTRDLETPTEILSVHDYENICAVNIAREAWGLRSWNGYSDIENWMHDGSVVRDRSRDTFTSASSEISSCLSQDLKNAMLIAPPFPRRAHTYSNVFIKSDQNNQGDYANTDIYQCGESIAKPIIIEGGKDPLQLEPILEEIDDLGDLDLPNKKRLNSESSLVATIDEIRKATITNSPRNIYRREHSWDSPQLNTCNKIDVHLKKALWKEPSKINSSNILKSALEKENILRASKDDKANSIKKDINGTGHSTTLVCLDSDLVNRTIMRQQKLHPNNYNYPGTHLQDLSNKDIDYLWQLVSETSLSLSSNEDLTGHRMSTSLQSLIQKETPTTLVSSSTAKISNIIKGAKNKPRRKLSVLREKFEPRAHSDEEMLYNSDVVFNPDECNKTNVRNKLDAKSFKNVDGSVNRVHADVQFSHIDSGHIPDLINSQKVKVGRLMFLKEVASQSQLSFNH